MLSDGVMLLLKETIAELTAKGRQVGGWEIWNRYADCAYHRGLGGLPSWPGNNQTT